MLNHVLLDETAVVPPLDTLSGADIARAKIAAHHKDPLLVETVDSFDKAQAREAFSLLSQELHSLSPDEAANKAAQGITRGGALAHLDMLLTAYDWDFISRAREIRNYVVGNLMEISQTGSEKGRLSALKLLGNVTEVGLFTTRVEVTSKNMDDATLEAVLKDKLQKYVVTDVAYTESPSVNG